MLDQAAQQECALEMEVALEAARKGILAFTCYTMPEYQVNWHHLRMAQAINRFVRGEITRLIITLPPRHGKSQLVSRHLPAFILGRDPQESIIACSYSADLSSRMNRDVQRIIDGPAYQQVFPGTRLNSSNVRAVAQGTWLRNSDIFEVVGERGVYRSSGVGGGITGMGGTCLLIDDPIKNAEEANSALIRDRIWEWYGSTLYTRLEKNGRILVVMTRWHEDDLVGRLLKAASTDANAEQWVELNLPALNETGPSVADPRQPEEALWPEKYDSRRLAHMRTTVGERVWTSLYQQRPAPMGGNLVRDSWWQYWTLPPEGCERYVLSVDLTFKDTQKADFSVFQVWATRGADRFLIDQRRGRMAFNEQERTLLALLAQYPKVTTTWVEDAANGAALVDRLRSTVSGLIAVPAKGSKQARAEAITPQIEAGNVYLPHPTVAPWVLGYTHEWSVFPHGEHDDQVDATSQALKKLARTEVLDELQFVSLTKTSHFL